MNIYPKKGKGLQDRALVVEKAYDVRHRTNHKPTS
jgi:hypothetical protein